MGDHARGLSYGKLVWDSPGEQCETSAPIGPSPFAADPQDDDQFEWNSVKVFSRQ